MAALAQFLRDRVNDADLNGDLSKVILQVCGTSKILPCLTKLTLLDTVPM